MKQDKALKTVFSKPQEASLPYGFDMRVMREVAKVAERKQRRRVFVNYLAVSLVSLVLVVATVLLINHYFDFAISVPDFSVNLSEANRQLLGFSLFIAAIALFVLMLDLLLRKMWQKRHSI